jgi:hypothetical protein
MRWLNPSEDRNADEHGTSPFFGIVSALEDSRDVPRPSAIKQQTYTGSLFGQVSANCQRNPETARNQMEQ